MIKLLHDCSDIIPHTLKQFPKIKNPYPNVDCHSGVLLYSLGLKEYEYYTVVFAVSRALGCTTWLVWDRIYNMPI
jgi:citrate synthase